LRQNIAKMHAVADISFDLCRGETLSFVGKQGCGKSSAVALCISATVLKLDHARKHLKNLNIPTHKSDYESRFDCSSNKP
jgi:ABC-type glutathione transport system ATPase component